MRSFPRIAIAFATLAGATVAHAGFYTYTSTTAGPPTYNRAVEDGTTLSGVGTATAYHAEVFVVDTPGTFYFTSLGTEPPQWDNMLFLYFNFYPTDALQAFAKGNDDLLGFGSSGFTHDLVPGSYTLVTTGFTNSDQGVFVNQILGPGNVAPVPEPASIAALGVGAAALLRRRKRA
jgi:hypothetical protein